MRQDDIKLLVEISYMYYNEGALQSEIGKEFNISRSLVSRYLAKARELGIVEIVIHDELVHQYHSLEKELKNAFNLKDVIIVDGHKEKSVQKKRVANAANKYLLRHLRNGDVVAVTGGTTVDTMSENISSTIEYEDTFLSQ